MRAILYCVVLIVLGFVCIYAVNKISEALSRIEEKSETTSASRTVIPEHGEIFLEFPLSEHDKPYATAAFDHQFVYADFGSLGWSVIGTIHSDPADLSAEGKMKYTFSRKDGVEVGWMLLNRVPDKYESVILSRLGMYQLWSKQYNEESGLEAVYPDPVAKTAIFLERATGIIYDAQTDERIGHFRGDVVGAAGAFCILTGEVHSDTKYSDFLYAWENCKLRSSQK